MKYAVLQCVNGNFSVVSEGMDQKQAFVNFHSACTNLWNSPDVETATVQVVDEKFNVPKIEYIELEPEK